MKKKSKLFKISISILAIALFVGVILYLLPIIKNITTAEGRIEFKEKIDKLGIVGWFLLFGLQLAQIFLIIIPGEPIEILAGMCYGAFGGFLFITISVAIITALIMFLVRMLGRKFVYEFFSKEKIKKMERSKMLKNKKRLEWIMIMLFVLPGTPKDLIVYLGALLPINPYKFIAISTIARFPSVISSTLAGTSLASGKWETSIIIYFLIILPNRFLCKFFYDTCNWTRICINIYFHMTLTIL